MAEGLVEIGFIKKPFRLNHDLDGQFPSQQATN